MNRRRLLAKRRVLPSKAKPKDFEKQVEKAIREANERIKSISKKYKGTTYMWSFNKLKNKVGSRYIKNNRLKIPKNTSRTDLLKVYKEVESFLDSKESTKKGIKETQRKAKDTIKQTFNTFEESVTDEDVDTYYSMFEDDDFNSFLKYTGLDPSEFWIIMQEAKEHNDSLDSFLARLETYVEIPDENVRQKAINLYNKYVK